MDQRGGGSFVPGWNSRSDGYVKEILLRLAAYRVAHGGDSPPRNSLLWSELNRLRSLKPRRFRFFRPWRRASHEGGWPRGAPLVPILVQRSFLTDDFSESDVIQRLESWPMITAYRRDGRVFTGEWFTYTMEVRAECRRQAHFIVDSIFTLAWVDQDGPVG